MLGPLHRSAVSAAIGVCVLIALWLNAGRMQSTSLGSKIGSISLPIITTASDAHLPKPVALYFDQVFAEEPKVYDFPALREHCDRATWGPEKEDVYLQCDNLFAGLTSIMSELKTCLKMAVEAGTGIILPTIALRDSTNLKEFNTENPEAFLTYDQWFDVDHLKDGLGRACPRMKVLHPDSLNQDQADKVTIKNQWQIDVKKAPGYRDFSSHFWTGNPFVTFFNDEFARLRKESPGTGEGISVIKVTAIFLLFRITDDPTGDDLALWNDLGLLMRFLDKPREVVNNLMAQIRGRPFYGVHFRVENDTVWDSLENQLAIDLDALDQAWSMYKEDNGMGPEKPLVYIACGDEHQIKAFVEGGKARGWDVTHKWELARQNPNPETANIINELAFDFQGAIDLGMMVQSHFFIGISGSALSNTVAHVRDVTGRYRGSSLREKPADAGARSHIVHDGQASSYPCCL